MSFFKELKRRNVFRVGIAYALLAWLLMQIGEVMAPALHLPEWTDSFLAFVLILGFPVALFFAWAFQLTPEGLRREEGVDRGPSAAQFGGRRLNVAIALMLIVAAGYFFWNRQSDDTKTETKAVTATQNDDPVPVTEGSPAREKSVAILPFQNRSADEENAAFFADGVHDELLTNLSRIEALKVISRTSVAQYRDTTKTMRQIGEELGVTTLLEGGVQRAGDSIRINVQLIDAKSDQHLWAETYDRQLTAGNIFDIQTEIAMAITGALQTALSPEEQARLRVRPTDNLQAYEHYLLALQLNERANWEALDQALEEVNQALALDPSFGAAYTLRAQVYATLLSTGARTLEAIAGPWEQAIKTAIETNPGSGLAEIQRTQWLWLTGEQELAMQSIERALQLEPNNAVIQTVVAGPIRISGDPERALALLERARELDPLSTRVLFQLSRVYSTLGEPMKSIAAMERLAAIDPASSQGKGPMAGPYIRMGQLAQAMYWIFAGIDADPADLDLWNWVVRLYLDVGDDHAAQAWLKEMPGGVDEFPFTLANQARIAVRAGELGTALQLARTYLNANMANRWGSEGVMVRVLLFDAIRSADQDKASDAALELLASTNPEILGFSPELDNHNALMAVDSAHLLLLADRNDEAIELLNAVLDFTEQPYALAGDESMWLVTTRAQALALLGRNEEALEALQAQVEAGFRTQWQWETVLNPNFKSLAKDPAFADILTFLERDAAQQLRDIRAMQAAGEIPPLPVSDA